MTTTHFSRSLLFPATLFKLWNTSSRCHFHNSPVKIWRKMSLQGFCPLPQDAGTSKTIMASCCTWLEGISELAREEIICFPLCASSVQVKGETCWAVIGVLHLYKSLSELFWFIGSLKKAISSHNTLKKRQKGARKLCLIALHR